MHFMSTIIKNMRPANFHASLSMISFILDIFLYPLYKQNLLCLFGGIFYNKKQKLYFEVRPRTEDLYFVISGREDFIEDFMLQHVSEGDTVIDVGANIGYYTLHFAKKVGPKGKVIAIEPIPKTMKILELNCKLNGIQNVVLINKAASDRVGRTEIHIPRGFGFTFFGDSAEQSIPKIKIFNLPSFNLVVPTTTLDFLTKGINKIKMIKIDAEGAEAKILFGADETLRKTHYIYISSAKKRI